MSLIDLRFGRWQDVLADVSECDALITDPPYSERTAKGYRTGSDIRKLDSIDYGVMTEEGAKEFASWGVRVKRWTVIFADHTAWRFHETAWTNAGWYTFAPVIWVKQGAPPRFSGDGPASQVDHIMIARRRARYAVGSLPGWYLAKNPTAYDVPHGVVGEKSIDAMRALIRDYTRKGDLVVDPYAGSGTTAIACAIEGRRCITAECDSLHYEIARKRIAAGYTMDLLAGWGD